MNRVAAVVVTYNRLEILRQCIHALSLQTALCDILVVDNASSDGTDQWAADTPGIQYRNTGSNLGGAGGFHFGIRWAVEEGYDYVWVMDDDCIPAPDALKKLMETEAQLNGYYGWLSSKCLWTDGSLCPMNIQRKNPYQSVCLDSRPLVPAQMASFVSLFLSARTVKRFGLPIREFFIWTDDWEYTRRISRELPCYVVSDSRVIHAMKQNTVVNISRDTLNRLPRYRYAYRNDVVLYRREGIMGHIWLLAKNSWHTLQVLLRGRERLAKICCIWQGYAAGLSFFPEIEFPCIKTE